MISEVLISHKIPLHLPFVLCISSKNSNKLLVIIHIYIYTVCSFAYCSAAYDTPDILQSPFIVFKITSHFATKSHEHELRRACQKKLGDLNLWLLITSRMADVAYLMFCSSGPEICRDSHSSLTLNRWCIRQLLKGHAYQFQELPTVCMAPCQKLQKNQWANVPRDLPLTKWITNSILKMIKK